MANRYWRGGSGNWVDTAHWSTSSGGTGGASVPTASDNVFIDSNSGNPAITITGSTANLCNNFDCSGASSGNLVFGAGTAILYIYGSIVGSAGVGGFKCSFAAGSHPNSRIVMASTSAHTNFNPADFCGSVAVIFEFNGSGGWDVGGDINQWDGINLNFVLTQGSLDTKNYSIRLDTFVSDGILARTLSLGSSTILVQNWSIRNSTNFTLNAGTSQIGATGAGGEAPCNFDGGSLTYYNVVITSKYGANSIGALTGSNTFHNLNFSIDTFSSHNLGVFYLKAGTTQTVTGTFSADGTLGGGVNRRMIIRTGTVTADFFITSSLTTGQLATISAAAVTLKYIDFMDITGSGAATWSGTRLGDAGGNSGITFPAQVTRYWVGDGGEWSVEGGSNHWATSSGGAAGASVPVAHDIAIFDANSFSSSGQTVQAFQYVMCSMDWTGVLHSPLFQFVVGVSYGAYKYMFGNQKFATGILALSTTVIQDLIFTARTDITLDMNGAVFNNGATNVYFQNIFFDIPTGGLTLLGNFSFLTTGTSQISWTSGGSLHVLRGYFDANDFNVTANRFNASYIYLSGGAYTSRVENTEERAVYMGSGTWTINRGYLTFGGSIYASYSWDLSKTTNLDFDPSGSTIVFATNGVAYVFEGGGESYNNLTVSGNASSSLIINGENFFNIVTITTIGTVTLEAAKTHYIDTLHFNGISTALINLRSSITGTQAIIYSNTPDTSYLDVQDSYAQGSIPFLDCPYGIDSGNNLNWDFVCMPTYNPSIITAVARVQQNMPFPQFVFGGAGGAAGTTYALFKKSSTYGFHVFRTEKFKIGQPFDVKKIKFNLIPGVVSGVWIIPVLYFDNEISNSPGKSIKPENYPNQERYIELTPKNFSNSVHGEHEFFLEFQVIGATLATIALPVMFELDIYD